MASSKDRERALARAKVERQMARRAEKARIQRQRQSQIGIALAVLLVLTGIGAVTHWYGLTSPKPKPPGATCSWITPDNSSSLTQTGDPATDGIPDTGTDIMTINLSNGSTESTVTADMDVSSEPCTAFSFRYLASKDYFSNTPCHRLTTDGLYVLQCGDPSGTGSGGPSYQFIDENLPLNYAPAPSASVDPSSATGAASSVIYPAGTIAMANSGPNTNGSQFFLVYKDSPLPPSYSIVGQITSGLDAIQAIAKDGTADGSTDGKPKDTVTIKTLTVDVAPAGTPTVAPTPSSPSSAPSPSASKS